MSRTGVVAVLLAIAFIALVIMSTVQQRSYSCSVCITFAGGSSSLFCTGGGAGGGCLFTFNGDVVLQASIDVGLIIAF